MEYLIYHVVVTGRGFEYEVRKELENQLFLQFMSVFDKTKSIDHRSYHDVLHPAQIVTTLTRPPQGIRAPRPFPSLPWESKPGDIE